jgi:hypothetical protein
MWGDEMRRRLLSFAGGAIPISALPTGSGIKTPAGEKFTLSAQNHSGYPENSTTLWSEVTAGVTTSWRNYYNGIVSGGPIDIAMNWAVSSALAVKLLVTTLACQANNTAEFPTFTANKFPLARGEFASISSFVGEVHMDYFQSSGLTADQNRIRYVSGAAIKHMTRDGDGGANGRSYLVDTDGTAGGTDHTSSAGFNVFPALNIPNATPVASKPDTDGYYILEI